MPTYGYECTSCGHTFELFQGITDPPRKRCPKCRHKVERRIGSGAGIIFRGSGFYATDYRSKEYTDRARKENGSGGDSGGDSAGGSKKESTAGEGSGSKEGS